MDLRRIPCQKKMYASHQTPPPLHKLKVLDFESMQLIIQDAWDIITIEKIKKCCIHTIMTFFCLLSDSRLRQLHNINIIA